MSPLSSKVNNYYSYDQYWLYSFIGETIDLFESEVDKYRDKLQLETVK